MSDREQTANGAPGETGQRPGAAGVGEAVFTPSAAVRALGDREWELLREVGRQWDGVCAERAVWQRALPVDPRLEGGPTSVRAGGWSRFGGVEFSLTGRGDEVVASQRAGEPGSAPGRMLGRARRWVLGPPLESTAVLQERMRKLVALAVLSSDALSSVAYGPEAMLSVLVLAGTGALGASLPIAAAIVVLMVAVGLSYRQTIRAYPGGGGSYIVASDNLGRLPGLFAAAGLMLDYVLTVAVSVAAGIAAIASALPGLRGHFVLAGLITIAVLAAGNLRGVRQTGALFAAPTYAFIVAILLLDTVGLVQAAGRGFAITAPHHLAAASESLGLLVVLRAFSSGATAMTGIEAISDGVPAFKPVEWRNARTTLSWMVSLLIVMFAGTVLLGRVDGVVPGHGQTVLSQLADSVFGHGTVLYLYVQAATALVLLLAANTAFNDFPRLLFFLARDDHAPRSFLRMGDRLAFSNGILLLAGAAGLVYAGFDGRTERLIPLFAVGVFLAFTLSQSGMVVHWWRGRDAGWKRSIAFNALGAGLSAVVLAVTATTKFIEGAWVTVLLVGLLVAIFVAIGRHYRQVLIATRLHPLGVVRPRRGSSPVAPTHKRPALEQSSDPEADESPDEFAHLIVVPVELLDLPTVQIGRAHV